MADTGTHTVTLLVTDINGNVDSCTASINVECLTNTQQVNHSIHQVSISPNPVQGQATIRITGKLYTDIQLTIFDLLGRQQIVNASYNNNTIVFSSEMLESGVYIYQLSSGQESIHIGKLTIE